MIGYYNYTVILTYIGMISGVVGLTFAARGLPLFAVLCLLFSGFCDLFDGKVARSKKDRTDEERRFGIQIDSLSDLICFGVLPCAIGFSIGLRAWWWTPLFCVFILAALARLAYYNVTEETRQKYTSEVRRYYCGLPVTSAAITFPAAVCLFQFNWRVQCLVYALLLLATAICFVAPIRVPKPHKKGILYMIAAGALIGIYLLVWWIFFS